MDRIQPGDKVICIEPVESPYKLELVKDRIYTVLAMKIAPCGCIIIDIGHRDTREGKHAETICRCGLKYVMAVDQVHYWHISRFKKIDHLSGEEIDAMLDQINADKKSTV